MDTPSGPHPWDTHFADPSSFSLSCSAPSDASALAYLSPSGVSGWRPLPPAMHEVQRSSSFGSDTMTQASSNTSTAAAWHETGADCSHRSSTPMQQLTPLHSPLTPTLSSLGHTHHLLTDLSASAPMLDLLHPSISPAAAASSVSIGAFQEASEGQPPAQLQPPAQPQPQPPREQRRAEHKVASSRRPGGEGEGDEDDNGDDGDVDDSSDEEYEEESAADGREIDLGSSSEDDSGDDSEDGGSEDEEVQEHEQRNQREEEGEEPMTDGDDNDELGGAAGLDEWIAESERNGVSPVSVLQRLLSDYGHLPISRRWLFKRAYALSGMIQQTIVRQASRRVKLPHVNTLEDVCGLLQKSKKIVVLSGAGISVSAGIPDFRSRNGIYPRLKREFGMDSPEAMFDLEYFRANPAIFFTFARDLWPGNHEPTVAHRFIRMLEQRGKLLRNYTQNIDALEMRAGISRVLQCHGSFASARCMSCKQQFPGMAIHKEIMAQIIPKCPQCCPAGAVESVEEARADGVDRTFGVIKPEITFFGESLPDSFRSSLLQDRHEADLVIVMGSSLKVQPVAGMLSLFSKRTPLILINREVVGAPDEFDVEALGNADDVCAFLAAKLGWELPACDPSMDSFRHMEPVATKNSATLDDDAAASSSSHTSVPLAPLRVSAPSPPPGPASPVFVAPNRFLFSGCQSAPSPSPSPSLSSPSSASSASCSGVSLSQREEQEEAEAEAESCASPLAKAESAAVETDAETEPSAATLQQRMPRRWVVQHSDEHRHGPEHAAASARSSSSCFAPATPHLSPLRSPVSSPTLLDARPPSLQLGERTLSSSCATPSTSPPSAATPAHDLPDLKLTCTPTRPSRRLPHAMPAAGIHAHSHTQLQPPPTTHDSEGTQGAASHVKAPRSGTEQGTSKRKGDAPFALPLSATSPPVAGDTVLSPASLTVHQPQVKRRKVAHTQAE